MTCREVTDFIIDYVTGELPDVVRDVFEQHMSLCPNCREYLTQYLAATELGRRAYDEDASAVTSGVPEELVAAILAARPR